MKLEKTIEEIKLLIPKIDKEIDNIIKENFSNQNEIERFIDYLMHPILKNQFDKLIDYYSKINKAAAQDYKRIYKEIWD
ncbi:MAG: hypothetical protein J4472_02845 [DPANN group archaeon]|nr:hypothetical protein [DPANN group archaeon]HIH52020.1 hypothetical protein [Nanoarchaeota archaeon]